MIELTQAADMTDAAAVTASIQPVSRSDFYLLFHTLRQRWSSQIMAYRTLTCTVKA